MHEYQIKIMSQIPSRKSLPDICQYYNKKLIECGETPQGVDWNGVDGQFLRFHQLIKVIDSDDCEFSVNDLGCGYGAFVDILSSLYTDFTYTGIDISEEMIAAASRRYDKKANVSFVVSDSPSLDADYGVASGIFNVKLNRPDSEWLEYLIQTLADLNRTSRKGFAFNCLTSYSDSDRKKSYLYYADPCFLFDFCKRKFARNVAVFHDYGLYEFTVVVRK